MSRCTLVLVLLGLTLQPAAQAQEMPTPRFAVGDSWSYRETDLLTRNEAGQVSETVTAADATEYRIDSRRQARTVWRVDAATLVHREQWLQDDAAPGQRGKTIAINDGGCAYPWPLKVGQGFSCTEESTWPNGWKVRYDLKFTVEAAERVQTPAGTFDTLRLVGKGYANNLTTNNTSRHERIYWLSPEVKREVKHEIRTVLGSGKVFKVEGRELLSFKAGAN